MPPKIPSRVADMRCVNREPSNSSGPVETVLTATSRSIARSSRSIVLFNAYLPGPVQHGAELVVGLVIIALAVRLLVSWRRGRFHAHAHRHGAVEHRHLHPHAHGPAHAHSHDTAARLGRSPRQAYVIGLVHGMGGSAGVGVLLLAAIPAKPEAAAALALFAFAAAISMTAGGSG